MDLQQLEAKNFKPRDGVLEQGQDLLEEILGKVPEDGTTKVIIVDQGKSFFFSLVAGSKNRLYSLESRYLKKDTWGWPRDWQTKALIDLVKRLLSQIRPTKKLPTPKEELNPK